MTPRVAGGQQRAGRANFYLRRQLMGFVYTIPTLIFVVVLFVTPLAAGGAGCR